MKLIVNTVKLIVNTVKLIVNTVKLIVNTVKLIVNTVKSDDKFSCNASFFGSSFWCKIHKLIRRVCYNQQLHNYMTTVSLCNLHCYMFRQFVIISLYPMRC